MLGASLNNHILQEGKGWLEHLGHIRSAKKGEIVNRIRFLDIKLTLSSTVHHGTLYLSDVSTP